MKSILILICFVSTACAELNPKFVRAIHKVETGGRLGAIKGDRGRALGPLQIHFACWKDSGIKGNYSQCKDLAYSKLVMEAYLKRYVKNQSDFETMARVWNGGIAGPKNPKTILYWKKVQKNMLTDL